MTCERCGSRCHGRHCSGCEQDLANERRDPGAAPAPVRGDGGPVVGPGGCRWVRHGAKPWETGISLLDDRYQAGIFACVDCGDRKVFREFRSSPLSVDDAIDREPSGDVFVSRRVVESGPGLIADGGRSNRRSAFTRHGHVVISPTPEEDPDEWATRLFDRLDDHEAVSGDVDALKEDVDVDALVEQLEDLGEGGRHER